MSDDIVFKFKRSGAFNKLADDFLSKSEQRGSLDKLKSTVEAMVLSDIENNSGLLESLAKSKDRTVDQRRVALMFERRIRSEIESGLAGKPIEECIESDHDQLLRDIKARLNETAHN